MKSKVRDLAESLRLTLHPVDTWLAIVCAELEMTEAEGRELLFKLDEIGKLIVFADCDGVRRVAHTTAPQSTEGCE